ncbi:MAG TPA: hypothetical protein VNK23_11175 [Candidatus Dormibacteraeota bacterium]|nr:hypothetical protein [Candidatus Dormibacteraeota bacterium]
MIVGIGGLDHAQPKPQPVADRIAFRVAGTCFGIFGGDDTPLTLDAELRDFAADAGECDVRIDARWADQIARPAGEATFDSGGLWTVFHEGANSEFYFATPYLGSAPYKALTIDREFRRGELLLSRACLDASRAMYPLEYPLDELLMIHRLGRGEGVEMHAMGLVDEAGRGHLFLGHSGAGKSTTARLWQRESRALILSDDRIILCERDGRIWMHGTPWHGDAGIASPKSAPLYRAYLIEHGSKTQLAGVSKGRAAAEFLARSFVPHYSADAMAFTLEFLDRVAQQTPCFAFKFLPDQSAVEAICRASD